MPIDTITDPQMEAIACLVRAAVHADLGEDVLLEVYSDPRDLFTIASQSLPAIAVYRLREQRRRRDEVTVMRETVVAFDYALPSSDLNQRGERWPMLAKVWEVIERAMAAGGHPTVQDGADVLEAARVYMIEDAATASYSFTDGGRDVVPDDSRRRTRYPLLEGRITFEFEPEPDFTAANLADFLRFYVGFYKPGTPDADMNDAVANPGAEPNLKRLAETRVDIPQD